MNMLKKLFSLCLALAVILSLAVPAFATDEVDTVATNETFTITINPSPSNENQDSHKDHTYEAYQILSGMKATDTEGRTVLKNPAWGGNNFPVTAFVEALIAESSFGGIGSSNLFSVLKNSDNTLKADSAKLFADIISAQTFDTAQEEKLAEIAFNVITEYNKGTGDKKCTPTDESSLQAGSDVIYELVVPAGFYMIIDKHQSLKEGENKDYTDIILHVSDNVNIYHKGSIPTLSKAVSELGSEYTDKIAVATGTEFYYRLIGTLPDDFSNYSEYKYVLHDEMDPGITFKGVVEAYIPRGVNDKEVLYKKTDANGHGYSVYTGTNENDKNVVEISFDNLKHDNAHNLSNGDKIFVIYKAELNENAVIGGTGNNNSATLIYSNNPSDTDRLGHTNSNTTKVYTYGLNLNKYDGATPSKKLQGVEFVLFREHSVTTDSDTTKATVVYKEYAKVNNNGVITSWIRDAENSGEIPADASKLITDSNGQIRLYGLDSRMDYFLKETKSTGTYNEIIDPIKIYLTAAVDENNNVNSITAAITGSDCHVSSDNPNFYKNDTVNENGTVTHAGDMQGVNLNIPNYLGAVLPSTGGIGTTVFYIAGAILVLGAVVLLVTKKRMS